jgi:hypothetical protein
MKLSRLFGRAAAFLAATMLGAVFGLAPAHAGVYTFSTPSGSMSFDGKPLDATATFTTSAGLITLVLTNLQPTSTASQLLSDVYFTASGVTGTGAGSFQPSGAYINVASCTPTGSCTGARSAAGAQNLPWTLTATGSDFHLNGLGNPGAAGLIIGPSTNANASINGSVHNPYLDGTATFLLALSGVTAATTISNVAFSFGTNGETIVPVPIPAAVWLFGSGLLGLIGIARRRQSGGANPPLAMA